MFCDQCGSHNRDEAKFCINCGVRLNISESVIFSNKAKEKNIEVIDMPINGVCQTTDAVHNIIWKEWLACFWKTLKSIGTTNGRISATTSWKYIIIMFLIGILLLGICSCWPFFGMIKLIFGIISCLVVLCCGLIFFVTMLVQRLHDLNFSGYCWWLIMLIIGIIRDQMPLTSSIFEKDGILLFIFTMIILIIYSLPGDDRPNKYGETRK